MRYFRSNFKAIAAGAVMLFAVGCATTQPQQSSEPLLSAAGFHVKVATTAQQQAQLRSLVPGKVTLVHRGKEVYYVYPDVVHNQVYVGNQAQYQAFQRMRLARQLSNENLLAAELNQQASMRWGM